MNGRKICFSVILLIFFFSTLDLRAGPTASSDSARVQKALQEKKYDEVIELLSPRVEKLGRDDLLILANAYSQKGDSGSALKVYGTLLASSPRDVKAKRLMGLEHLKLGKEKEAKSIFREIIEINPKYEDPYLDIAGILEKKTPPNRYDIRLLYLDLVKNLGKKPLYITKLCELTTLDGLYDTSTDYCKEAISLNKDEPRNYIFLAKNYKETGHPDLASQNYRKGADGFPASEFAQMEAAGYFFEEKDYVKSLRYYQRAFEVNPQNYSALFGVAHSALEIPKYEVAFQAMQNACRMHRSASTENRKIIKALKSKNIQNWSSKFEGLIERCGLKQEP